MPTPVSSNPMVLITSANGTTAGHSGLRPAFEYLLMIQGNFNGNTVTMQTYDGTAWIDEPDVTDIDATFRNRWLCTGIETRFVVPAGSAPSLRVFCYPVQTS